MAMNNLKLLAIDDNQDNLTVVSGLFDRNGNMVTGASKTVEMRLK